ncbi:MAG: T9SS type A sorting domain-containing protein [Paludibacter sp.]|nr:T9SS type A sorting domain-containing protein [Paludibacter sp.]
MKKITFLFCAIFMVSVSIFAANLTVTGSFLGNNWVNNAADYLMTQIGTTNVYSLEKTLPAGTYEFKVFYTGTWNGAAGGTNAKITLTAEKTVKFYAKDNGTTIDFVCDAQELYVIGATVGGWSASNMKAMTMTSTDATYTADVVAGDYKIVSLNGTTIVWDFVTPANQNVGGSGNYTIKLDFVTFAVTATNKPSITSVSNSYIFLGEDPATAAWYNGSATAQPEGFNGKNLGSVLSPIFIGGEIQTAPVISGVTVKMFYQIDELAVKELILPFESNNGTTSTKWKSTAGTNVFTDYSLVRGTAYTLKVWFNATDGTATLWDSNNSANYVASFTYDLGTGINPSPSSVRILSESGIIKATFNGSAQVELFTFNGQLVNKTNVENNYSQSVKSGVYLLRINGETQKVIVR